MNTDSQIFSVARELPEKERDAYLDSVCGGDTVLKDNVIRLLEADEPDGDEQVDRQQPASSAIPMTKLEAGMEIGPYRLVSELGTGGMGLVWSAQQTEPVRRRVAIKFVRPELASPGLVARFNAECQALALMSHSNIAQMLDAGTLSNSQPYFAMEFVDGQALTAFCDANQYSIRQRLLLFLDVCAGVQHAHQKGVIHRDLKPTNILVAVENETPTPKVIDFGLAKAIGDVRLTENPQVSVAGMVVGSFQYMSPEQAGGDNKSIDTRSDVYALGAVLYELLTGSTPIDESEVKTESGLKVLELIRNREPDRPSAGVRSMTKEERSRVAANRHSTAEKHERSLAGDLDWILLHCLEKEPSKRYASAVELTADIRAHLEDQPVAVRQRTGLYIARKFYQRHKLAAWTGTAVFLGLLISSISLGYAYKTKAEAATEYAELAAEEAKARKAAEELREKESTARQQAVALGEKEKAARIESEEGRRKLRTAVKLLQDVYEGLNPELANAGDGQLRAEFLGRLKASATNLIEADLGGDDDILVIKAGLANTLIALGEESDAIPLWTNICNETKTLKGEKSEDYMTGLMNLAALHSRLLNYEQARSIFSTARKIAQHNHGEDSQYTCFLDHAVANLLMREDKPEAADKIYNQLEPRLDALGLRSTAFWCDVMQTRGQVQTQLGRHADAIQTFRGILDAYTKRLKPTHPSVLRVKTDLSLTLARLGNAQEGIDLMRSVVESTQQQYPSDSGPVGRARINLATMLANYGKPKEAVRILKDVEQVQSADFERLLSEVERVVIEHKYKLDPNALEALKKIAKRVEDKLGARNEVTKRAANYLKSLAGDEETPAP